MIHREEGEKTELVALVAVLYISAVRRPCVRAPRCVLASAS